MKYPDLKRGSKYSIPEDVTYVDDFAFENCIKIKRLVLPESIESLEGNAFARCYGIE